MIYYKNMLLSLSNGLNTMRVSQKVNPYQDQDAQLLGMSCNPLSWVRATNGREYYYFWDCAIEPEMVQFLLNKNGVLAFQRYSQYLVPYMGRRLVVRVPVSYVASHPMAQQFIDKVKVVQNNASRRSDINLDKAIVAVQARMKQK